MASSDISSERPKLTKMRPFTQRRGDGPVTIEATGPVLAEHAEPTVLESSAKGHYIGIDWRPAFEEKSRNLVYSSMALQDQRSISNGMKMGEAYHECVQYSCDPQGMYSTTSIGEGYYMRAMTPGADFCASRIQEAQRERIETLDRRIREGEQSEERCDDELYLLRNWMAPCRGKYQQAMERSRPEEQPGPAEEPSTCDELDLGSPESPLSPREDGLEDGYFGASTLTSATDAAQRGQELSSYSMGSLADLHEWVLVSELAGLEETTSRLEDMKLGLADGVEDDEADPSESSLDRPQLSLLDFLPLSHSKSQSPVQETIHETAQETSQGHMENRPGRLERMVRKVGGRRGSMRPTAAEKGKWAARCDCPRCQPRRVTSGRFDPSAMDQAVKAVMVEADPRGEGCSSWVRARPSAGPGRLAQPVELDMFTNPSPTVPVAVHGRRVSLTVAKRESARKLMINKRDISEPTQLEQTDRSTEPRAGHAAAGGHTAAMTLYIQRMADEQSRRKARGGLSRRLSKRLSKRLSRWVR